MSKYLELHFPIDLGRTGDGGKPKSSTVTLEARVSDEWPGGGREAIEEFAAHVKPDAESADHTALGWGEAGAHAVLRD